MTSNLKIVAFCLSHFLIFTRYNNCQKLIAINRNQNIYITHYLLLIISFMTDISQKIKLTRKLFGQIQQNRSMIKHSPYTDMSDENNICTWIMEGREDQYPFDYAYDIVQDKVIADLFRRLLKTPQDLSDANFRKKAEEICGLIIKKLQGESVVLNDSIIKKKEEEKKSNIRPEVRNEKKESNVRKNEKDSNYLPQNKYVLQSQKKREEPKKNEQSGNKPRRPQKFQIPMNQNPRKQEENQNQKDVYNIQDYEENLPVIPSKDLKIKVNYEEENVDIKYCYKQSANLMLQKLMVEHINNYLTKKGAKVVNPAKQVEILNNDQILVIHQQAGSYEFDPFHQVIEVRIRRTNGAELQKSFKSDGNFKISDIDWVPVKQLLKKSENPTLQPKDVVEKLAICVCKKKGQMNKVPEVIKALKEHGGAYQVQDLFPFQQKEIKDLGFQKVYAYEIYKFVQRAKGFTEKNNKSIKIKSQKQIQQEREKKLCLKIGNSHKILRYLVYKTDMSKLRQISLINYQNMNRAVNIVKKAIINDELWELLARNFFFQFASNSIQKTSNGMILYGPPGTGKTQITQRLPQLIGFHLIDEGKSAADFSTSYVGQTKRMLEGLVDRARISPYIQCSVGIDEVDGLIPDRKDKKQGKSNTEGISILLSLVGGNKAVSNLIFLTSTNHLKKIDEAMLRRFSGQYQVGRLAPKDRKDIILGKMQDLKERNQVLEYLLNITSNFTGAALIQLISSLKLEQQLKRNQGKSDILTFNEITGICSVICSQFKIKLGMYSLPQILSDQNLKKYSFNMKFLQTIVNQTLIISRKRENPPNSLDFTLTYGTAFRKNDLQARRIRWIFERNQQTIKVQKMIPNFYIDTLERWIKQSDDSVIIEKETCRKNISFTKFIDQVGSKIRNRDRLTIMLIEAPQKNASRAFRELGLARSERTMKNLFIFYFIGEQNPNDCARHVQWRDENETSKMKPFSGRIFVELKDNPKMDFELKMANNDDTPFYEKTFLRTEKAKVVNDVAPQLIDFFTKRNVSSIFLLDYNTLMDNDAFDDQKQLEIVRQKVQEAINYNSVAIIIQADSLINISKNLSQSSMGPSNSYSITNHNMSQFLMSIMKTFAMVQEGKQKWITIVAKDKFLVQILKESMSWPLSEEDKKKKMEEQEQNKKRRCKRCHAEFTRKQNKDEKKCMQHPGKIISMKEPKFMPMMSIAEVRSLQIIEKNRNEKKNSQLYIFACCAKGLNEQGEKAYEHIQEGEVDEVQIEMKQREKEWDNILNIIKKSR